MPIGGTLVIGYGNTLRGDDGAGVQAAELIAMRYPNVNCLTVHQLSLDLAETISQHSRVIFLDASVTVSKVTVTPLRTNRRPVEFDSHHLTPLSLLHASRHLYERCPHRALQIEIPSIDFSFGENPSPDTMRYVEQIVREFHRIADSPLDRWISTTAL